MDQNIIFSLEAREITKRFKKFLIFKDLNISLKTSSSLAVTGHNGSGKSTLLEVIAGIQRETKGAITYRMGTEEITRDKILNYIGFSSFRINPYGELTGNENIHFVCGYNIEYNLKAQELLGRFNLFKDKDKVVKHYSSGMKQRLRFLLAAIQDPPIFFIDEPGANLDRAGKDVIYSYIDSIKNNKIIVIATNEEEEAGLCNERITLGRQHFPESSEGFQG